MNAYKLELYGKMVNLGANLMVLAAVALGMYQASFAPDAFLSVFSQWFFAQLLAVLALTWLAHRTLRRCFPVEAQKDLRHMSVVHLPRRGPQLVSWRVLHAPGRG